MQLFELRRDEDESGVSGTGTVAQGVIFDNGQCVLTWLTPHTSVAVYQNIEAVIAIHGHGGKTRVVRIAHYDADLIRGLLNNYCQDEVENINRGYMAEQREKFVQLFLEKPIPADGV